MFGSDFIVSVVAAVSLAVAELSLAESLQPVARNKAKMNTGRANFNFFMF